MPQRSLLVSIAAVLLLTGGLLAQTPIIATGVPMTSTEFFFVPDYNVNPVGNCQFDNIVLSDASGVQHTVTFTMAPQAGTGTYGPLHPEGADYMLEFVWIQDNGGTGFTPGHSHNTTVGTDLVEQSHRNAVGSAGGEDLQGFRLFRNDGGAFSIVSFDYAITQNPILIGTSFTAGYASTASWQSIGTAEGLVFNDPNFNQVLFDVSEVASIVLDPNARLEFPTPSTISLVTRVAAVRTPGGVTLANPSIDPIIGAFVTISGNFTGADTTFLEAASFSPVQISIVEPTGINGAFITAPMIHNQTANNDYLHLDGSWDASPTLTRPMTNPGPGIGSSVSTGGDSPLMAYIASQFPNSTVSLVFDCRGNAPILRELALDYSAPTTVPEAKLNTSGTGDLVVGLAGFAPGSEVFNLFDLNATQTVGSGPFFGMNFGPFQIDQIALPLGAQPFHVTVSPEGSYFFGIPPGSIAAGTVIDHTAIELLSTGSVGAITPVERINF